MKPELLLRLRSPATGSALNLEDAVYDGGEIATGRLVGSDGAAYPIVRSVPRFVPPSSYADNFGFQWNTFRRTQLDSTSGVPISRDRWYNSTGWSEEELRGRWVLDVGCGAGRFAEVALKAGAHVVAVDYSSAVDACWANLSLYPRLHVVQGDIYHLPFAPGAFDFVYCFGVLQHTPDVAGAFANLPRYVAPGGGLAVDVYAWLWRNVFWSKYWFRPITKHVRPQTLFRLIERLTPTLLTLSRKIASIPVVGRQLRYLVPVANYEGVYPLSDQQLLEWAILDTFDMFGPLYDKPQSLGTLKRWFEESQLEGVVVERLGMNVGRGRRAGTLGVASPAQREEPAVDRQAVRSTTVHHG